MSYKANFKIMVEEENTFNFHRYNEALPIQDPTRVVSIEPVFERYQYVPPTRREKIMSVLKTCLFWFANIVVMCGVSTLVLHMAIWFNEPLVTLSCCYTGFQLVRLMYVIFQGWFDFD